MTSDLPPAGDSQPPPDSSPDSSSAGPSDPTVPAGPAPTSAPTSSTEPPNAERPSTEPSSTEPSSTDLDPSRAEVPSATPGRPSDPSGHGSAGHGSAGHDWSGHGWSAHGATGPGTGGPGTAGAATSTAAPSTAPGQTGHGSDEFFDRVRSFGVVRPEEGRWAAGVAAGISRRWDIDPILVRGGFVALSIFGGLGAMAYGLAWLLLPQEDGRIHVQQAIRGDVTAGFAGGLILALAAIGGGGGPGPWHDGFWFPGGLLITAAVVFGIWWLAKRESGDGSAPGSPGSTPGTGTTSTSAPAYAVPPAYGSPPASAPNAWASAGQRAAEASRAAGERARLMSGKSVEAANARRARSAPSKPIARATMGIALLTAAAIAVIGNANDWSEPVGLIAVASALAVVAAGVIVSGLNGRRAPGLVGIGMLLTITTLLTAAAEEAGVRTGQNLTLIGQKDWAPTSPEDAESQYNLGVGEATLWLTDPAILRTATTTNPLNVRVRVGAGHMTVILPDDVSAQVNLTMGAGEVVYPDGSIRRFNDGRNNGSLRGGQEQQVNSGPAGAPTVIVDVEQGAGQLDLETSARSWNSLPTPTPPNPTPSSPVAPSTAPAPPGPAVTAPAPSRASVPSPTVTN